MIDDLDDNKIYDKDEKFYQWKFGDKYIGYFSWYIVNKKNEISKNLSTTKTEFIWVQTPYIVKAQLHFHTDQDPMDLGIDYDPYEAIEEAYEKWYKIISFTHHDKLVIEQDRIDYAMEMWILLISWVELNIEWKHILVINPDIDINHINSFKDLENYKLSHPDILIIAPHPFYKFDSCLNHLLYENRDLFDWIEFSLFFNRFYRKANQKAIDFAVNQNKTIIWTADVHKLKLIDQTYSFVWMNFDIDKLNYWNREMYIKNFIKNIKLWRVIPVSDQFSVFWWVRYIIFHYIMNIKTKLYNTLK